MAGRRGNGDGSIYQDPSGRWRAVVWLGYKDGKPHRKYLSGTTKAAVTAKLRAMQRQADDGVQIRTDGRPPTVGEWLGYWLENIAARKVRVSTIEGYRGYVRNRIEPAIGRHRLDRLQPEHLEQMYRDLAGAGLKPASVLQCHRIVSRALKVAVQRGKTSRNVATLVDPPSVTRVEITPLTADEARAVLAAAAGRRNAARWSVALALGLRQGEALGLIWDSVGLDAGMLTVRQALQRQQGAGLVMVPPKSRTSRRTIPLPVMLVDALRAQRTEQLVERLAAGADWQDHGLVFANELGRPVDPSRDRRDWNELLEAAGARAVRLHDARHTAATLLLAQGVHPRVVMEMLGHSGIALTMNTYTHVPTEVARDAAARMSKALWG